MNSETGDREFSSVRFVILHVNGHCSLFLNFHNVNVSCNSGSRESGPQERLTDWLCGFVAECAMLQLLLRDGELLMEQVDRLVDSRNRSGTGVLVDVDARD